MLHFVWTALCDKFLPFLLFRKPCPLVVLRGKLNRGKTSSIRIRRVLLSRLSNSPMERLDEGFLWRSNLKRKSFFWVIGGRGEPLKSPTLTMWWKFRREKTQCSLTLPMRRTLAWRGLSTTRANQLPPTVEWKRSMTTRADHIASSWQLVLFFQVSLIFQIVEQSCVLFFEILK